MTTDYLSLISKHTAGEHKQTVPAFIIHSALVTKKALDIAHKYQQAHPKANINFRLLEEMGMLHDIGIFRTNEPKLFTKGDDPYITHILHGAAILEEEGLPTHARASLTHTGITRRNIEQNNLPLPLQDYLPETIEEEILCLADTFFSKRFDSLFDERTPVQAREMVSGFGEEALTVYDTLCEKYL